MLYLIVMLSGAFLGAMLLVSTGLPVVALRYFQCLPLDRRFWWTMAAIVAVRCVRQIAMAENGYVVPTVGEKLAAFNAFLLGGYTCIGALWLFGVIALIWLGGTINVVPVSKLTWPVAGSLFLFGAYLSVDHSDARRKELSDRRTVVVTALKSRDLSKLEQLAAEGERLHHPLEELGSFAPFGYAIEQQDIPMIQFFMNRPDPDRPDMKVWMGRMMATGNQEIIDLLFEAEGFSPEFLGRAINVAVSSEARKAFDYPFFGSLEFDRVRTTAVVWPTSTMLIQFLDPSTLVFVSPNNPPAALPRQLPSVNPTTTTPTGERGLIYR